MTIDDDAFVGLDNLKDLRLNDNNLTEIKGIWFRDMRSLKKLSIEGNPFVHLPSSSFDTLPRPIKVSVSYFEEPSVLQCTGLCWLKGEEENKTITWFSDWKKPKCSKGIKWDNLTCRKCLFQSSFVDQGSKQNRDL